MKQTRKKKRVDPRAALLQELGAHVRERRQARGMRQQDLADELDLSVAYVSLIERGGRNPPWTTVVAIADALGTNPGELLG